MDSLPEWIKTNFKKNKYVCQQCKTNFNIKHIKAVGIKYSYKEPSKEVLFIDCFCLKCGKTTMLELRYMCLAEWALEILEEIQMQEEEEAEENKEENFFNEEFFKEDEDEEYSKDDTKEEAHPVLKEEKSRITIKDIKESVKFLHKNNNHKDFLEEIGLTPEEIHKYTMEK